MLRIPHCLDNRLRDGGQVASPIHQPHFTPQKHYYFYVSGTHFCLRLGSPSLLFNEYRGVKAVAALPYVFMAWCVMKYRDSYTVWPRLNGGAIEFHMEFL
jgi:hypothetical protein